MAFQALNVDRISAVKFRYVTDDTVEEVSQHTYFTGYTFSSELSTVNCVCSNGSVLAYITTDGDILTAMAKCDNATPRIWNYSTPDSIATVTASGYFSGKGVSFTSIDSIKVQAADGEYEVKSSGGVASLVRTKLNSGQEQLCVFGNSISEAINNFGTWFARNSGGAVVFKTNAGVGGNNTNQMIARLSDIDGTLVTVMEATNDYAAGVTLIEHRDNIATCLDYVSGIGSEPLMIMAPPHDTAARSEYVFEANLYDYVTARKKGIKCFGIWDELTDPSTGAWVSGASSDGTHPDPAAEQTAGYKLADDYLNNRYYTPLPRIDDYTIDSVILNPNGCFTTGTYGAGLPNNWATNGNQNTQSLAETSLGIGNTWQVNWVNSQLFINSSRWNVTEGDTYLCVMRFSNTINSGSCELSVFVQYDVTVNSVDRVYMMRQAAVSVDATTLSVELEVPEGVSSLRFAISADAGTFDVDINIAQAQMFNLTHYGL